VHIWSLPCPASVHIGHDFDVSLMEVHWIVSFKTYPGPGGPTHPRLIAFECSEGKISTIGTVLETLSVLKIKVTLNNLNRTQ